MKHTREKKTSAEGIARLADRSQDVGALLMSAWRGEWTRSNSARSGITRYAHRGYHLRQNKQWRRKVARTNICSRRRFRAGGYDSGAPRGRAIPVGAPSVHEGFFEANQGVGTKLEGRAKSVAAECRNAYNPSKTFHLVNQRHIIPVARYQDCHVIVIEESMSKHVLRKCDVHSFRLYAFVRPLEHSLQ
jgi:hypothetical protein